MTKSKILLIDAAINLILGVLLLFISDGIIRFLGIPSTNQNFYPNILGGVLFGIGIALILEYLKKPGGATGLGLGGAIAINMCGGLVLLCWLIFGSLNLPLHGKIILWSLALILLIISIMELISGLKKSGGSFSSANHKPEL
jgi:hypothetical protein